MSLSDNPTPPTLRELLLMVGPALAELVFAPDGPSASVEMTVIEDPGDVLPPTPGGLLLLVGIAPDEPAALHSVARAAAAGCSGVVVKRRDRPTQALVQAARASGIAVVAVPSELSWRRLDALISSAISSVAAEHQDSGEDGGQELFSIANAIAGVVGGSVAIEDLAQQVLAYSSIPGQRIDHVRRQGILDRQVPANPHDVQDYRAVLSADGVVRFPHVGEEFPRAAIAIRAGTLPLGTLWAIEGEGEFSVQAEHALIDGARLAALHMLRSRNALDLDRLRRGELLRGLLELTGTPEST